MALQLLAPCIAQRTSKGPWTRHATWLLQPNNSDTAAIDTLFGKAQHPSGTGLRRNPELRGIADVCGFCVGTCPSGVVESSESGNPSTPGQG